MNRTRLSLLYLASYLIIGGVALLLAPDATLKLLGSNGHYGAAFPRLAGMALSGLGASIATIIRVRAEALYPGTLIVRSYFIVCLTWFYRLTADPFFLVVIGVVALGVALTLTAYLLDRVSGARPSTASPSPPTAPSGWAARPRRSAARR